MPTGRIKFYDSTKGFGFAQTDEGEEVHVPASALPAGVTELRGGTRVEFGVAEGRRGKQALSLRVLDAAPSVVRNHRPGACAPPAVTSPSCSSPRGTAPRTRSPA